MPVSYTHLSIEKLKWELAHTKEELKDREIEYSNLQEQIAELDELDDSVKGIEKELSLIHICNEMSGWLL